MHDLALRSYLSFQSSMYALSNKRSQLMNEQSRRDRWVVVIVVSLALIAAVGLMAAWWISCQRKGMYPALDMPPLTGGGTWKVYCKP